MANKKVKNEKVDPRVKDVLKLLGAGVILTTVILMPGTALLLREYEKIKLEHDKKEWEKFNLWRLRGVLKRLQKTKMVEVEEGRVKITEKGKQKLLRFNLENIEIKERTDGKWRLIIYDISNLRRKQRDLFREMLKRLRLYRLQESVYLTPFVCDDEIEFLRQTFGVGGEVQVLKVSKLENDEVYRKYFGV